MPLIAQKAGFKTDLWLPVALLLLPVLMQLLPLIIETDPRRGLYYTPLTVQVFLIAIILYAILTGATKQTSITLPRPILWAGLVLSAVIVYSTIFRATNSTYALEKTLDLVSVILVSFLCASLFSNRHKNLANLCLRAIFWSISLTIPVMLMLFWLKLPADSLWPNFMPGFTYVRIYGFSLAGAVALGIGFLGYRNQPNSVKLPVFLALILLWMMLFWTSSRGGIFSLMAVSLVFFIAFPKSRWAILAGFIAMFIGAALSVLLPIHSDAYGFFQAFDDTFKADSANRLSAGRLEMWQARLTQISERPFFGHGYGQNTLLTSNLEVPHAHTHNIVVETAQAWGWVGAAAAGYLVVHGWLQGFIKTMKSSENILLPAFFLLSVMAVYSWVDGVYFYYQSLIPMAICLAVMLSNRDSTLLRRD